MNRKTKLYTEFNALFLQPAIFMIKEAFLHFVWRLQYFHKQNLLTTQGEQIQILHPGILNSDSGPDFTNARIKIGDIEWYGNVEIHVKASDWKLHRHQNDEAYDNVILHIVWINDEPVKSKHGALIPTIELKDRISEKLILKYSTMVNNKEVIPCAGHFKSIDSLNKIGMLDRMVVERLQAKSVSVKTILETNNGDWQETAYQLLAKNFGFKINADPFLRLATSIPLKSLLWHRKSLFQIESLLYGQSGLLQEDYNDDYPQQLKKEYEFLSKKFSLHDDQLRKSDWKFLRIRPANFPTIRIAEFASFIFANPDFFTSIIEFNSIKEIHQVFKQSVTSDYWNDHFVFDKKSDKKSTIHVGEDSIDNIIINTVVPYLFCFGKEKDNEAYVDKALYFLEETKAEQNKIIRLWDEVGFEINNAYESQGAIELYNNYCLKKNCLNCEIGMSVLKEKEVLTKL